MQHNMYSGGGGTRRRIMMANQRKDDAVWNGRVSEYYVRNGYFNENGVYKSSASFYVSLVKIPRGASKIYVFNELNDGGVANSNTYSVVCNNPNTDDMTYADGFVPVGTSGYTLFYGNKQLQIDYFNGNSVAGKEYIYIVTNSKSYQNAVFEFK